MTWCSRSRRRCRRRPLLSPDPRRVEAAAEVGGVDEGGAAGIEFRDEDVGGAYRAVESARGGREAGRGGVARYVGVAGDVHRDAVAEVVAVTPTAAEVGRVSEHRIDDQWPAAIVCGDLKADAIRAFAH